jgi:hypothetical protein
MPQPSTSSQAFTVEGATRVSTVIWAGFLVTQVLFVVVAQSAKAKSPIAADPVVIYALLAGGMMIVVVSYVIKFKLMAQAVAAQSIQRVQSAIIVALALCEVVSLIGIVTYFILGAHNYFVFMIVAMLGILGHFPRRSMFDAASAPKPIL